MLLISKANAKIYRQHATVFHQLKAVVATNPTVEVEALITQCGLEDKKKSAVRILSGGQKRKLQLIMMLIGGSRTCCVDEVSGGLDPLSRRRIWDILLAERGNRTFILTTHFLDEAEYLADHITIISKGVLKAEGSISELKARLGEGYRVSVSAGTEDNIADLGELSRKGASDDEFRPVDAATALARIKGYKAKGIKNFQITGPTIEEVFMKIAVAANDGSDSDKVEHISPVLDGHSKVINEKEAAIIKAKDDLSLLAGHRIGTFQQIVTLFKKRLTILRWKWIGTVLTILIPVIGTAMISLLIKNFHNPGCAFIDQISFSDIQNLSDSVVPQIVVGPQSALTVQKLELFTRLLPNDTKGANESVIISGIKFVNTLSEFINFTQSNYTTIVPGGFFLGTQDSVPTFNYQSDIGVLGVYSAVFIQNAMNVFLSNQSIATSYGKFIYDLALEAH